MDNAVRRVKHFSKFKSVVVVFSFLTCWFDNPINS